MTVLRIIPKFLREERAAGAAEFALVLPLVLLFLFGIIDVGVYSWKINKDEKATQMGARMAVVTNVIATGLAQDYVGQTIGGVTLSQGDVIPAAALGTVSCNSTACTCTTGPCPSTLGYDTTGAFGKIVARMQQVDPASQASNVVIEYRGSGLGYAGDPSSANGLEISPLTTVRLQGMNYSPLTLFLFKASVPLPSFSYALTMEDGYGTVSN